MVYNYSVFTSNLLNTYLKIVMNLLKLKLGRCWIGDGAKKKAIEQVAAHVLFIRSGQIQIAQKYFSDFSDKITERKTVFGNG